MASIESVSLSVESRDVRRPRHRLSHIQQEHEGKQEITTNVHR